MTLPSRYVGEVIALVESSSPLEQGGGLGDSGTPVGPLSQISIRNKINIRKLFILAHESTNDHMTLQMNYLGASMSYVAPTRKRYIAQLSALFADLCVEQQNPDESSVAPSTYSVWI